MPPFMSTAPRPKTKPSAISPAKGFMAPARGVAGRHDFGMAGEDEMRCAGADGGEQVFHVGVPGEALKTGRNTAKPAGASTLSRKAAHRLPRRRHRRAADEPLHQGYGIGGGESGERPSTLVATVHRADQGEGGRPAVSARHTATEWRAAAEIGVEFRGDDAGDLAAMAEEGDAVAVDGDIARRRQAAPVGRGRRRRPRHPFHGGRRSRRDRPRSRRAGPRSRRRAGDPRRRRPGRAPSP